MIQRACYGVTLAECGRADIVKEVESIWGMEKGHLIFLTGEGACWREA